MGRLEDKVAVITGTASGIGAETAELFMSEGARVVGVDLSEGARGDLAIQADVTDSDQVKDMYEQTAKEFGRIDVLFNNAGISPDDDVSVLDTSLEAWQRVQDVNLKSVFLCCQHGIPHLLKTGGGSVINTASFVAVMGAATPRSPTRPPRAESWPSHASWAWSSAARESASTPSAPARSHAAAPGALREGPGEGRAAHGAPTDGPLRRAPRDRPGRPLPGERRHLLRHRLHLPRGRRPLGRVRNA